MKTKKTLFKTSGILRIVASAIVIFLFGLVLLLGGVVKSTILDNPEYTDVFIESLVQSDPSLQGQDVMSIMDYSFRAMNIFSIVMVLLGIIGIALGVFNILFASKYELWLKDKKALKVIFAILCFAFYAGLISNILTLVAICLKDEDSSQSISPSVEGAK